jgi:hypothetical protein
LDRVAHRRDHAHGQSAGHVGVANIGLNDDEFVPPDSRNDIPPRIDAINRAATSRNASSPAA